MLATTPLHDVLIIAMEDDEWQDLSDALLGDAAEFETAGSAGSEEQLLMPGAHTAMSMDDWDTLANELLDGSVAPDEQDDDEFRGVLPPREQGRKRGRPRGTYGSRSLRQASVQASQQAAASADPPVGPQPGTIAYAREMKRQKEISSWGFGRRAGSVLALARHGKEHLEFLENFGFQ